MMSDHGGSGAWIALKGARLAPNETVDAVVNNGPFDLFWTIGAFVASFFVEGARALRETPELSASHGVIRVGRKRLAVTDISRARLLVHSNQLELGDVDLCFGLPGKIELAVLLRDKNGIVAPKSTRALLAEALASSSIEIPRDTYDPKGRFARSGSPFNVTREEAIALLLDPPPADGDLPIIR